MREYKTNKHHTLLELYVQAIRGSPFCPVQAILEYVQYANHTAGPLFQTYDALPISYSKVSSHLRSR